MPSRTSVAVIAAVTALAIAAAGCGDSDSDGSGDGSGGGERPAATTTGEGSSTAGTPTTEDHEGISELTVLAHELLLTQAEVAVPSFQDAGYTPYEGPNECGVDVDADHPPEALVGTILGDGQRTFQQEIRVYPDTEAARVAFDARSASFGCGTGSQGTTYDPPTDVNEQVGADAAVAVGAAGGQVEGLLVTALIGDAVVSFVFARPPGADVSDLPDAMELAAFGVGKILAALET